MKISPIKMWSNQKKIIFDYKSYLHINMSTFKMSWPKKQKTKKNFFWLSKFRFLEKFRNKHQSKRGVNSSTLDSKKNLNLFVTLFIWFFFTNFCQFHLIVNACSSCMKNHWRLFNEDYRSSNKSNFVRQMKIDLLRLSIFFLYQN